MLFQGTFCAFVNTSFHLKKYGVLRFKVTPPQAPAKHLVESEGNQMLRGVQLTDAVSDVTD